MEIRIFAWGIWLLRLNNSNSWPFPNNWPTLNVCCTLYPVCHLVKFLLQRLWPYNYADKLIKLWAPTRGFVSHPSSLQWVWISLSIPPVILQAQIMNSYHHMSLIMERTIRQYIQPISISVCSLHHTLIFLLVTDTPNNLITLGILWLDLHNLHSSWS